VKRIYAGVQLASKYQLNYYTLAYMLQSLQYLSNPQDNHVGASSYTEFTCRNGLDFNLKCLVAIIKDAVFWQNMTSTRPQRQFSKYGNQYHLEIL
jgi:hypothetical protein